MKINYNVSAMVAHTNLNQNDNALSSSIERLSSGLKINHAKDNASGLAMAKRMNAQLRSLEVANQNANDGISVIEIAEGALTEIEEMIQRMNELAVKACNGTMTDNDREAINAEVSQLKNEIERISETTMYNGSVLLNGDYDVKGYTDNPDLKVTTYSDSVVTGNYKINSLSIAYDADGNIDPAATNIALGDNFPTGAHVEGLEEDRFFVKAPGGFEIEYRFNSSASAPLTINAPINIDITGLGSMGIHVGTNEGQELDVRISTISLRTLGLENKDVCTLDNASEFLDQIKKSLDYINTARSNLGAYQNRLEHTVATLDVTDVNMTAAYSRIMDVDMAEEMTEYTKNNVLVQASTSMLAQANERPSSVLQLLQ